jgi:hypothetical protein
MPSTLSIQLLTKSKEAFAKFTSDSPEKAGVLALARQCSYKISAQIAMHLI